MLRFKAYFKLSTDPTKNVVDLRLTSLSKTEDLFKIVSKERVDLLNEWCIEEIAGNYVYNVPSDIVDFLAEYESETPRRSVPTQQGLSVSEALEMLGILGVASNKFKGTVRQIAEDQKTADWKDFLTRNSIATFKSYTGVAQGFLTTMEQVYKAFNQVLV